jgi:hypothetical protein
MIDAKDEQYTVATNSLVFEQTQSYTRSSSEQSKKYEIFIPNRLHSFSNHVGENLIDISRIQCISPIKDGVYSIILVSGVQLKNIKESATKRDIIHKHWDAIQRGRIVDVCGWLIDIHRIQCISSPCTGYVDSIDMVVPDAYSITLVSAWELKLREKDYSSIDIKNKWKAFFGELK